MVNNWVSFFILLILFLLLLKWILILLVLPFQIIYNRWNKSLQKTRFHSIISFPYKFWERIIFRCGWERYMLMNISTIPSCHFRKFIYKLLGANIGKNVVIHYKTEIRKPNNLTIGKGSIIGDNALLDARLGLLMGENVNLSSNVSIYTQQHDHRDPYFRCTDAVQGKVIIDDRVWIGSNVIILPRVRIGEGAVCCAGCVVTKDVEPYSVVAGIPAKKVNERPRNLKYVFDGKSSRLY